MPNSQHWRHRCQDDDYQLQEQVRRMEREHALEIQVARGARAKLEDRCNRLEDVVHDQETILQRQEEARIQKDYDTKQMTKKYEESLREYETRIGIRDQQFFAEKDKSRRAQMELQNFHMRKHEIIAQAKREEREAIKRQANAIHDRPRFLSRSGSGGGNSNSNSNNQNANKAASKQRNDQARQGHPASGNMFTRAFSNGAAGAGSGGASSSSPLSRGQKSQQHLRKASLEDNLSDFFML